MLSVFAAEEMNLSLADSNEHSTSFLLDEVAFIVSSMPFTVERAQQWFSGRFGGYSGFIANSMNLLSEENADVKTICHVILGGSPRGFWIQLYVSPSHPRYGPGRTSITPADLLAPAERQLSQATRQG
jgi:hypothetical protein